jgi:hypothetical protein
VIGLAETLARFAARLAFLAGLAVMAVSVVTVLRHEPAPDASDEPIDEVRAREPEHEVDPLLAREQAIAVAHDLLSRRRSTEALAWEPFLDSRIEAALDAIGGIRPVWFQTLQPRTPDVRRLPTRGCDECRARGLRCCSCEHHHRTASPKPVTLGVPVATEGLSRWTIERYLKRDVDRLAACNEHRRYERTWLEGTIVATFLIDATGSVSDVHADGFDLEVARCVERVVGRIAFPRPADGVRVQVSYPINFVASHASSMAAGP